VSPDTRRGLRPRFARVDAGTACLLVGRLASMSPGIYFHSRPTRVPFVASNVQAELRFSSPEGESSPVPAMRSLSRAVRRDLQREFPHDRRSEADEQSHFFYLLILIRGCLERSLPLSLPSLRSLASPASSPSRLAGSSLRRALLPALSPSLQSTYLVLINRASCTMPVAAVAASHSVAFLCSPFAFSDDL